MLASWRKTALRLAQERWNLERRRSRVPSDLRFSRRRFRESVDRGVSTPDFFFFQITKYLRPLALPPSPESAVSVGGLLRDLHSFLLPCASNDLKIIKNLNLANCEHFGPEKLRVDNGELLLAIFPGVGPGSFPPIVFLVFGIRFQNGAKECIL